MRREKGRRRSWWRLRGAFRRIGVLGLWDPYSNQTGTEIICTFKRNPLPPFPSYFSLSSTFLSNLCLVPSYPVSLIQSSTVERPRWMLRIQSMSLVTTSSRQTFQNCTREA